MYSTVRVSMFSLFDIEPTWLANLFVSSLLCDVIGQPEEGPKVGRGHTVTYCVQVGHTFVNKLIILQFLYWDRTVQLNGLFLTV